MRIRQPESKSNKWMQTDKASCHGPCTERQVPRQLALRLILLLGDSVEPLPMPELTDLTPHRLRGLLLTVRLARKGSRSSEGL